MSRAGADESAPTRNDWGSPTAAGVGQLAAREGDYPRRPQRSHQPGAVYMTYQWWVGACNELTQDNLDPISKTPETKYCAVKVEAIADQRWAEQYAWTLQRHESAPESGGEARVTPECRGARAPLLCCWLGGVSRRQQFLHQRRPQRDAVPISASLKS
jgi:hypothetical protein